MVPEGWSVSELSSLCEKISVGLAISVTPYMHTSGVKLIRNQNIKRNFFNSKSIIFVNNDFADKNKSKKVKAGDVVAVRTGSNIGKACVVPSEFEGALTFTTLIARPKKCKLESFYLSTHINSSLGISEVNRLRAGGGKPNLNSSELKRYRLLTPPLTEQKKIAKILSTWDKVITTTEQLLVNSKQQKKALMGQLLTGNKRLLDKDGAIFDKKWVKIQLGDLTKIYDGTHSTPKYVKSGVNFYSVEHLTKGDFSQTKFISEDVFEKENNRVTLEKDDILMTRIGDIGTAKHLDWEVRASFYVSLALIKKTEKLDSSYLSYYINSNDFQAELWKRTIHVAFPKKINLGEISNCLVSIPPKDEQQKIATVLSAADQETIIIQQQLKRLRKEKKALMQQLLTGKRRVSVSEGVV